MNLQETLQTYFNKAMGHLPTLIGAILVLIIGLWVIKLIMKGVRKGMSLREFDPTIQRFLTSLLDVILKVMLIISVASMLGIETTSFLAILTSAGLAVGLALQGGLANFAGGVLILIFKPFKVGDKIEAQGHIGDVQEISIFVTKLITDLNKTVILPNGPLANGTIVNITERGSLRVDLFVNIALDNDINKAKEIILQALKSTPGVLSTPAPSVTVLELADGYTRLAVRPHAAPAAYWDVYFQSYENIRKAMQQNGISTPTPTQIQIQR